MGEDKPIAVYSKNADIDQRIRLPKFATQLLGREYYMEEITVNGVKYADSVNVYDEAISENTICIEKEWKQQDLVRAVILNH